MMGAAAAGLFAAAAIPAQAADMIAEPPPAPPVAAPMPQAPVASWEGGYAGVAAGYGFSSRTNADQAGGPNTKINTDGFVGNGFAGWNWQSGSFVYGVEGDVGYNGIEGRNAGLSSKGGVDGTLRARVGVAATDNVLLYATAGGAGGRHKLSAGSSSDSHSMWGWTAGVGADMKVTEKAFARVEYRYTDLGSRTFSVGGSDYDVKTRSNKVLVGIGMQF